MKIGLIVKRLGFPLLLIGALTILAYEAESQTEQRKVTRLAGSTWSGTDSDGDHYIFTFEQDGTLAYKSPSGSFRNGTWNQFNGAIYLQMNNHHSEYLGEIDGDRIQGKAWNVKHRTWLWNVTKNK